MALRSPVVKFCTPFLTPWRNPKAQRTDKAFSRPSDILSDWSTRGAVRRCPDASGCVDS
jgi:hypothetical protein